MRPPVGIDRVLNRLYDRVNTIWTKAVQANNTKHQTKRLESIRKVSVISVAGGSRDPLVPTHLTDIVRSNLSSPELGLSIMSSRVKLSEKHRIDTQIRQASQDHLSILWCNQLLHPITEYLYEVARLSSHGKKDKKKKSTMSRALKKIFFRDEISSIQREANEVVGNEARRREIALLKKKGLIEALSFASSRTLRNNVDLMIASWFALCTYGLRRGISFFFF